MNRPAGLAGADDPHQGFVVRIGVGVNDYNRDLSVLMQLSVFNSNACDANA